MTNSQVPKAAFFCECANSTALAEDIVSLDFIWSGPAPRGGQFFMIRPRRTGVFLGRPISVAGWKAGENGAGLLRFLVALRGQGSRELCALRPGEQAELIGPLGKPWPIPEKKAEALALVGGGIGIAPLLALAAELGERPFDFYAGFRTGAYGLEKIMPRSLVISSEDGSAGVKGRITEFFSPTSYAAVFACGPEPMLELVSDACMTVGIPCFISMERYMACGVGACLGCALKAAANTALYTDYRLCCTDGPVFRAGEIDFGG